MTEPTTSPKLPSYANPNGPGYFHESHGISPQKAARMLVSVARSHAKAPAGKGKAGKVMRAHRSGSGLVRSAGGLFNAGGKK